MRNLTPSRHGRSIGLLLLGSVLTACGPAALCHADTYAVNRENTGLRFTDSSNSRTLISPNGFSLVSDTTARTNISVTNQPGGFDLVVTYTNVGSTPAPLGQINIGGIRFGQAIQYYDFSHDCKIRTFDHGGQTRSFTQKEYPYDSYSPATVISEGEYTIGMSLNYPLAEYNHRIDMMVQSPVRTPSDNGRNWMVSFRLWGEIPAGQTRTYTIPVRVAKGNQHWLETLKPYREYFNSLYGSVQYTRDPHPVRGFHISYLEFLSSSSQRGFYNSNMDPSVHGYGPWANYIRTNAIANGFERVMIWAPTGIYYTNRDDNYPCLFMTGADNIPIMRNSQNLFRSIADAGLEMGFWWGFAQFVSPGGWDSGHTMIDVDNPAHLALAWREMDRAVSLGATSIGLDAFLLMQPAPALRYLRMLRERYPQVKFTSEVSLADVYHVYAPTFLFGNQVQTPHYLADFLLPGQETWVICGYDEPQAGETFNQALTREMGRYADMGYVPLVNSNIPMTPDLLAAEGWNALPDSVRPAVNGGTNTSTNGTLASGLSNFLTRSNGNRPDGGGGGAPNTNTRTGKSGTLETSNSTSPSTTTSTAAGNSFAVSGISPANGGSGAGPAGGGAANIESNRATGTEEALQRSASTTEQTTLSGEATNALATSGAAGRNTPGGASRAGKFTSPRATVPPPAVTRGPSRVIKQSTAQAEHAPPGQNGSPIPTIFTLRSPYVDAIKNVFPDSNVANAALRRASSPAESQTAAASEK
jgi:hypothetical protein